MKFATAGRWLPRLLAAGGLALALAACSTETTHLNFNEPVTALEAPVAASASQLSIAWLPTEDHRLDSTSLGYAGGRAYVTQSILPWVDQQLRVIKGATFVLASDPTKADLVIKPVLLKFYIQNVEITKSAIVVLQLELSSHGKPAGTFTCRGQCTGMNWWNSDEEMAGAMRDAFSDCLRNVAASLDLNIRLHHVGTAVSG